MDWLGLFVPRVARPRRRLESPASPRRDDLDRLQDLRRQGSKLRLPHPVRAFLRFDAEGPAREAADLLGQQGYACAVRADPDGSWRLTTVTRVVPTPGALSRIREQLEAAGGAYQGWDAPVVR